MLCDKLEGQKIMFRGDVCTQKHNLLEANVTLRVSVENMRDCKFRNGLLFKYKVE